MAGVGLPVGMRLRPWLPVEAICPHALSMIQCRIKELAALRFQGAQLAIAHLGILDRRKKVRASTIATFRADRKLRPAALGLSDCTHKTQVARTLYFVQGAQPHCAAHLGELPGPTRHFHRVFPRCEEFFTTGTGVLLRTRCASGSVPTSWRNGSSALDRKSTRLNSSHGSIS